ncbi:MAG: plastocyanin/azurin family copper-binding protein [Rhodobacterales bacterium]|nr:plastocyanin/azurin family copper-binding protein [Rhodobacterales bacterium]
MSISFCGMFLLRTKPAWPTEMRRRHFLRWSGGLAAALAISPRLAIAGSTIEISMSGRPDGSKVWFDPYGLMIQSGQTVRWTNRDKGNSHTATTYDPRINDRPRRIPKGATPFNSDYLLPDESFEVTLVVPGVYDFYCIPHEMSGMVGRIIVAGPDDTGLMEYDDGDLPPEALDGMPSVANILAHGPLRHQEG